MSNAYLDIARLYVTSFFHPQPNPATGLWAAFVDFDAEIGNTSTQAAIWISALPDGGRTALGNRLFRVLGPTISFTSVGPNGNVALDLARARAVTGLLDQLIATLPTVLVNGVPTYPAIVFPGGLG